MKKQQRKQEALVHRMLPKVVVEKLKSGDDTADTFESVTLYFSSVVDFNLITKSCSAMEVNELIRPSQNRING